jgi:ubiquinone/menaquinone biosynthesis C-methylase UbiE
MPNPLPAPVKAFLKARLLRLVSSPTLAYILPFLPYRRSQNAYCIPCRPEPAERGAPDELALPPQELWAQYGPTREAYLNSGKEHVETMLRVLGQAGYTPTPGQRMLEFGCAAGRMIRWLAGYAATCEIWGTDVSATHIVWCSQHLNPPFAFFTTPALAHLPFEDRYFDLIYAGSVFTHIDDLADTWLLELRRVLRPSGRLYLTIHDRNTIRFLAQERGYSLSKQLYAQREYSEYIQAPFGKFTIGRAYGAQVFYDLEYLRRITRPCFELDTVQEGAYGYQTALVFRKRES